MTMSWSAADETLMARALDLAERGLYTTDPNPRVGCVLARAGAVIGEGWHAKAGEPHAEIVALRSLGGDARGATAYVTLEPCSHHGRTPPCADALIAAGIERVVCASADPNPKVGGRGLQRLEGAGITVSVGLLEGRARALNPGFFSRFERSRPWVRLKLAMSLDARTAPPRGGRSWISSEASRADVQRWRARSSAILTGAGTVRIDDPRLDVRLAYGPWIRQPLRVVLDSMLGCAPTSRVFQGGHVMVFAAEQAPVATALAALDPPVAVERVAGAGGRLDLGMVLGRLASLEINEVLVECGPLLAGALLREARVDELILYIAPFLLGADAAPLAALTGIDAAAPLGSFDFDEVERVGPDLRVVLRPRMAGGGRA